MGWEQIATMVDNEQNQNDCSLRQSFMAAEQASGLTSWYPGDALGNNGCHDGPHSLLLTRSPV